MTNISLTSGMYANLLSLRMISSQMSKVQEHLSSGLKVNSAIDNVSSFYQARSLTNRATDLDALLNAMGQGIQTIQTANQGIETGISILQQAKAVAQKASESNVNIVAKVHNEAELLAAVEKGGAGFIIIESNITLTNQIKLRNGQKLVGDNYFAENNGPNRKLSFDFSGKTADAVIAGNDSIISNLDISYETDCANKNYGVLTARGAKNVTISNINLSFETPDISSGTLFGIMANKGSNVILQGKINIQSSCASTVGIGVYSKTTIDNYADINISTKFHGIKIGNGATSEPNSIFNTHNGTTVNISSTAQSGIVVFAQSSLYIDNALVNIDSQYNGISNSESSATIVSNSKINIKAAYYGLGTTNSNTKIKNSELNIKANQYALLTSSSTKDSAYLNIDKDCRVNIAECATALRTVVYSNGNSSFVSIDKGAVININKEASSDGLWTFEEDCHLDLIQKPGSTSTLNIYTNDFEGYAVKSAVEAFPDDKLIIPDIADKLSETFHSDVSLDHTQADNQSFIAIISQYDTMINDASYQGINLLKNGNLKINFNENRTARIEIKGVNASAQRLGIRNPEWNTQMNILNSINELEKAISQLRSFASEFGGYYSIVTTRQNFTDALIDILQTGADNLILADINEESANYLALQTRQQLAINSLSLAAQSTQSILSLF